MPGDIQSLSEWMLHVCINSFKSLLLQLVNSLHVPPVSYYIRTLMKLEWNYSLLYQWGSEDCPA